MPKKPRPVFELKILKGDKWVDFLTFWKANEEKNYDYSGYVTLDDYQYKGIMNLRLEETPEEQEEDVPF